MITARARGDLREHDRNRRSLDAAGEHPEGIVEADSEAGESPEDDKIPGRFELFLYELEHAHHAKLNLGQALIEVDTHAEKSFLTAPEPGFASVKFRGGGLPAERS